MRSPNGLGFRGKTLWDWLQLLIVPAILIGVTFAWSASQDSRDKRRADGQRQDTTLNDYFQQMSDLMMRRGEPGQLPLSQAVLAAGAIRRPNRLSANGRGLRPQLDRAPFHQ